MRPANFKVIHVTVSLVSLHHAASFAFVPCPSRAAKSYQVQIHSTRAHKISFAEINDLSKQVPVRDDLINDRLSFDPLAVLVHNDEQNEVTLEPRSFLQDSSAKSPPSKEVWIARLLLLLSAALYGTNFTMVKSLDESLSVALSSTLRFGFAALCMLPWLLAPIDEQLKKKVKEKPQNYRDDMLLTYEEPTRFAAGLAGMEIGVYNSIGYITQAVGLKTIPANKCMFYAIMKSAFICSMAVVIVPILDFIFGRELLKRQVIGACLAAFGVYTLEMGGNDASFSSGDMISLVQPIMFGIGFWRMEAAMEKYPTEASRLAAAQLLMVFLVSLSYLICGSPFTDSCEILPSIPELVAWLQDPNIMGMLIWTGLITTAFTIWMETLALKTLSAAETTLIFSTEPLFSAAFAALVANEVLGYDAAIGAACIIGGCLVSGLDLEQSFERLTSKWNMNGVGFLSKKTR